MKQQVEALGIFVKHGDTAAGTHAAQLVQYLQQRKLKVLVEDATAAHISSAPGMSRPAETIGGEIDAAIVVGGDGTILRAARLLASYRVPIIGVNLGRVGFLADIPAEHMIEEVGKILDGRYENETRLMLHAEVIRQDKQIHQAYAFNDVVITKGELARLIEFETWLDGEFVSDARADGIIVASPTGSTAYALSAGGPILHANLSALAVVPICPHALSHRPIVVSADSVVEIVMTGTAPGQHAYVSFDGQTGLMLEDHDRVRVRRADISVELVQPAERSHFEVLRRKLHWGRKL
jgi:NAD+ kinase